MSNTADALNRLMTLLVPDDSTFKTSGFREEYLGQISNFPVLYVRYVGARDDWVGEGLQTTEVLVDVRLLTDEGRDPDVAPGLAIDKYVAMVRAALKPDAVTGEYQDLGGIAYYVRIEGETLIWPGDAGSVAEATIPVRIMLLVPDDGS